MQFKTMLWLAAALIATGIDNVSVKADQCPLFINSSSNGYYYQSSYFTTHTSSGFAAGFSADLEFRSYIVFDIPTLSQNPLSAELWLDQEYLTSSDGSEMIEVYEVTNSTQALQSYGPVETGFFEDLGDGALYGNLLVTITNRTQPVIIPLNDILLSKISSSQGSNVILGVILTTPNADETDQEMLSGGGYDFNQTRLALTFPGGAGPLQILAQPAGGDLLDGQEWFARVETCGPEPITYQWLHDGINVAGATNPVLHIDHITSSDAGTYTVRVTNPDAGGSLISSQAVVTVSALRIFGGYQFGTPEGYDFTLQVTVQSTYPLSFQWYHDGVALPNTDSPILRVLAATTNDSGSYFVVASNALASATNSPFTVYVDPQFPYFTTVSLTALTAAEGATVALDQRAYGAPPPDYYWFFNGAPLTVPTGPQLTIFNVNTNDAGVYTLIASNRVGMISNSTVLTVFPAGPLDRWTLRTPTPQPNDLHNIAYANGLYIAVGLNGALLTSTNGQQWAIQQSRTINELHGVAYGNGQFVIVGKDVILTSSNAVQWRSSYPGNHTLTAIAFGNGLFVATIRDGSPNFLVSTNGVDWQPVDVGYYSLLNGIAFGNGLFAAAGLGNGLTILTSSNGTEWAAQPLGVLNEPEGVRYAGGRFVLAGSSGALFTSNEGQQWIKRNTGITTRLVNVDFGNSVYVAVGVRGVILKSSNLIQWTPAVSGTPDRLEGVVFGQDKFVVVGESGTTLISPTGTSWANQGRGTHLVLDGITVGENGLIMAAGKNGTLGVSTNGSNWTFRSTSVTNDLHGVTFVTLRYPVIGRPGAFSLVNRYVAVGSEGTIITSDDGVNWLARNSGSTNALKAVTYAQGLFAVAGAGSTILTSSDGGNWRTETNPIASDFNDIAFGNGRFVIASDAYASLTSTDGHTWEIKPNYSKKNMRGVGFAKDTFALTGNDGRAYFSDGVNPWSQHDTGIFRDGDNLRGITYANGLWVIVGNNGIILTSPDTVTWTRRFSPVYVNLHAVRYINGTFVAIGNAGTILQSDRFAPLLEGAPVQGGFQLTVHPGIGDRLRIERGTTLLNWTNLTTITNPPDPVIYLDTASTNGAAFYRAVSP